MADPIPKFIVDLARENRKNATKAEQFAWLQLRSRKYRGYKFNRQFPLIYSWNKNDIGFYIASCLNSPPVPLFTREGEVQQMLNGGEFKVPLKLK